MTVTDLVLDTSALVEILQGTPLGQRLRRKFLDTVAFACHVSAITFGELAAIYQSDSHLDALLSNLRRAARIHDVTPELAARGGFLRAELRKVDKAASLVDAIILALARHLGAQLSSLDPAFASAPELEPLPE